MYTDLQMFDEAISLSNELNISSSEILRRQAKALEDVKDYANSARIYFEAGDSVKAVEMLGSKGLWADLKQISARIPKEDSKALQSCLRYLDVAKDKDTKKEVLYKLNDYRGLISLFLAEQAWQDAFIIAEQHPEYAKEAYLPYAKWLAVNDRFDEAKDVFLKAGEKQEALIVLDNLISNAFNEDRFNDISYYTWIKAKQFLNDLPSDVPFEKLTSNQRQMVKNFDKYYRLSRVFQFYHWIYMYINEPFVPFALPALLNMARFLFHLWKARSLPDQLSAAIIVYAAIKLCFALGMFSTLDTIFAMTDEIRFPENWINEIDDIKLLAKRGNGQDKREYLPLCYGCAQENPWVSSSNTDCRNCLEPFIFSAYSGLNLPLVKFVVDDSAANPESENPFDRSNFDEAEYKPVVLSKAQYARYQEDAVFNISFNKKCLPTHHYKLIMNDAGVIKCETCQSFFLEEEWNNEVLRSGKCIFCRCQATLQ